MSEPIVVDRSRWLNGNVLEACSKVGKGSGGSSLYSPDLDRSCCLGFAVIQKCGVAEDEIAEMGSPMDFVPPNPEYADRLAAFAEPREDSDYAYDDTPLATHAILANDNVNLTWEEREARLTAIFTEYGESITFTGPIPTAEELEREMADNPRLLPLDLEA